MTTTAQESKKYKRLKKKWNRVEGYVLTKDSVRAEGLIDWYGTLKVGRYTHVYFTSKDGTVSLFYPNKVLEFAYDSMKYVSDGTWFYRLIRKGARVALYRNVGIETELKVTSAPSSNFGAPGMTSTSYRKPKIAFFLKKEDSPEFQLVSEENFEDVFYEYFIECPFLAWRIKKKLLGVEEINEIVDFYNVNCD